MERERVRQRTLTMAVLGLAFAVTGCPPTGEEPLPFDRLVIVERSTDPPNAMTSATKDIVKELGKEPGSPSDEPPLKSESRSSTNFETPDATNSHPFGVSPPTVPGVAPIPALPAPTPPSAPAETPQPPGSGLLQPDK